MSTDNASTTSQVVVLTNENPDFMINSLRDELDGLKHLLRKETKAAILVLAKLMKSTDEKIQITAATKLLDYQINVAQQISTDSLNRLIASARLITGPKRLVAVEDEKEKKPRPIVNFNDIQQIG
jgi:hypothetical protein